MKNDAIAAFEDEPEYVVVWDAEANRVPIPKVQQFSVEDCVAVRNEFAVNLLRQVAENLAANLTPIGPEEFQAGFISARDTAAAYITMLADGIASARAHE